MDLTVIISLKKLYLWNSVIPAGILQPLFYSQHFPKSLNYGGIGVVIGHEITHGFDDKGYILIGQFWKWNFVTDSKIIFTPRQFDKDGNMMQWWNNATVKAFRERAQCIIDQYSKYKIDEIGMNINGKMTQGENIADNGGLKQSFRVQISIYLNKHIYDTSVWKIPKNKSQDYNQVKFSKEKGDAFFTDKV